MRERMRKHSLCRRSLIVKCNTNMGAIKQEQVRVTHTPFHRHQSYALNDVFVIQVTLSSRKGQEFRKGSQ
jgi:hypothetical protein